MLKRPRIHAIFYNNPDGYPPIINSSRLLAQANFEVDIFCRQNDDPWSISYPSSVHLHRIDTRSSHSWQEYLGFLRHVLRRSHRAARLFIGHDMHGLLAARILATRFHRPLVYHCHDYADARDAMRLPKGMRLIRAFEQHFARTADLVIVPDADRGAVMARELRLKKPPLIVANAPLAANAKPVEALTSALAAQGKQFERILFRQGRIGPGHAIAATVRSIPYWKSKAWGLVVMGLAEPDYLNELWQIARSLGVESQLAILPPVGYDQVAQFTIGASAGHALYEPIHINNVHITTASNKLMEYLAAGLPVLVSDRPALRALVEKYNCGLVADETAPQSIAAAVNVLLSDATSSRSMGIAATQAFSQVFCYEQQFAPALDTIHRLTTN